MRSVCVLFYIKNVFALINIKLTCDRANTVDINLSTAINTKYHDEAVSTASSTVSVIEYHLIRDAVWSIQIFS